MDIKIAKAKLWHAGLRLWMWKWQTLTPAQRALFYKQRPVNKVTYHWLWLMGRLGGRKGDFTPSRVSRDDLNPRKAFDKMYVCEVCYPENWVHYKLTPFAAGKYPYHRIDIVWDVHFVNSDGSEVKTASDLYRCVKCGLMGTEETFNEYDCLA